MALTQGHIFKVKVTTHTYPIPISWSYKPYWIFILVHTIVVYGPKVGHYTPHRGSLGGYIGITLSVCPSIRLSVQSKLNLGYNFWTKRDKAFILHMCVPCDKTFLLVPKILTSWPWPWLLTYFWKNLTLDITKEMGLSYFMCVFLVARPFCWYQKFWPCDLDFDFWPTFDKT